MISTVVWKARFGRKQGPAIGPEAGMILRRRPALNHLTFPLYLADSRAAIPPGTKFLLYTNQGYLHD